MTVRIAAHLQHRLSPRHFSKRPHASFAFPRNGTMQVAQRLYEQGHITYMRTDSTTLSTLRSTRPATRPVRCSVRAMCRKPRTYDRKVKNAQEAHEAIRPAGDHFAHRIKSQTNLAETKCASMS